MFVYHGVYIYIYTYSYWYHMISNDIPISPISLSTLCHYIPLNYVFPHTHIILVLAYLDWITMVWELNPPPSNRRRCMTPCDNEIWCRRWNFAQWARCGTRRFGSVAGCPEFSWGVQRFFPTKLENICKIIVESLATDSLVELVATKLGLDVRAKSHRDSLYACVKVFRRHELGQDLVTQCSYIKEGTPLVRSFSAMPYGPGKCLITWYTLPAHQFHPCFLPPAATQWQHSSAPTRTAGWFLPIFTDSYHASEWQVPPGHRSLLLRPEEGLPCQGHYWEV